MIIRTAAICILLLAWTGLAVAAETPIRHYFAVVDNGGNRLVVIDQIQGKRGWSVAVPAGARDVQRVQGDRLLVSHASGATEYALADGAAGWSHTALKGVSSAQRLSDGSTVFLTGAGLTRISASGAVIAQVPLAINDPRLLRVLDDGSVLACSASGKYIQHFSASGAALPWKATLPGKGYLALRQADGTTWATTGDQCSILKLDAAGTVLASLGGIAAHPEARLLWLSGFCRLANGNLVAANWNGHGKIGQGPHVVEFTPDNRLVWSWEDHAAAKTVTNVLVLE